MLLAAGGINNSILVVVLASAVVYGTPLLYAALGELLAERAGVLNLGVEGMMLVGAVMGFWAVQRDRLAARSRSPSPRSPGRRWRYPRVPRGHAAREPDRVGARADDLRWSGRPFVVPRERPERRRPAREALLFGVPAALLAEREDRRADPVPALGARVRLVAVRPPRRDLPQSHAARAQPSRGRRVSGGGGRDGDQRRCVSVRAHRRRWGVRRGRRCDVHARDHPSVGRRHHGRRRLDRDCAGDLRVLAADAVSRRCVLLRRVFGHPVHLPGARDPERRPAGALPGAAVRDDDRRARAGLERGRAPPPRCPRRARHAVRARRALSQRAERESAVSLRLRGREEILAPSQRVSLPSFGSCSAPSTTVAK